jgi:hypothetical protein
MPVPVISGNNSILAFGIGEEFTFQLTATEQPSSWAIGPSESLPPGVLFDTLRGQFTGSGTSAGIWNLSVTARNTDGTSSPAAFVIGVFDVSSVEISRKVNIDVETLAVTTNDPETATTTTVAMTARYGDDLLLKIGFLRGTTPVNAPLVMAKFAIRADVDLPPFAVSDILAFKKVIETTSSGDSLAYGYIFMSLSDRPELLDHIMALAGESSLIVGEFQLEMLVPSRAAGPETQILTTKPFKIKIYKDIIDPN